jgi:hypothetical protein
MTGLAVEAAAPFFRDPAKTAAQVGGESDTATLKPGQQGQADTQGRGMCVESYDTECGDVLRVMIQSVGVC